jgi:hypothetical protein
MTSARIGDGYLLVNLYGFHLDHLTVALEVQEIEDGRI